MNNEFFEKKWSIEDGEDCKTILDLHNGRVIAEVPQGGRPEQARQDAFLIASSNDLLEALLNIMGKIDTPIARRKLSNFIGEEELTIARNAISSATKGTGIIAHNLTEREDVK